DRERAAGASLCDIQTQAAATGDRRTGGCGRGAGGRAYDRQPGAAAPFADDDATNAAAGGAAAGGALGITNDRQHGAAAIARHAAEEAAARRGDDHRARAGERELSGDG